MKLTHLLIRCITGWLLLMIGCAHLNNARQAYSHSDYEKAIALCCQAIEKDSTDLDAYLLLIQSHAARNDLKKAESELENAMRAATSVSDKNALKSELYVVLGKAYADQGKSKKVTGFFKVAEELHPGNPALCEMQGDLLAEKGQLEKGLEKYNHCLQAASDPSVIITKINSVERKIQSAKESFQLGQTAESNGQFQEAISHYQAAVDLYAGYTEANFRLITTKGKLQEKKNTASGLKAASVQYSKALKIKPNDLNLLFTLAHVYEQMGPGSFDPAIETYQKIMKLDSGGDRGMKAYTKAQKLKEQKKRYGG